MMVSDILPQDLRDPTQSQQDSFGALQITLHEAPLPGTTGPFPNLSRSRTLLVDKSVSPRPSTRYRLVGTYLLPHLYIFASVLLPDWLICRQPTATPQRNYYCTYLATLHFRIPSHSLVLLSFPPVSAPRGSYADLTAIYIYTTCYLLLEILRDAPLL